MIVVGLMLLYNFNMRSLCVTSVEIAYGAQWNLMPGFFPPTSDVMNAATIRRCGNNGERPCNLKIERIIHQTYKSEELLAVDHPEWSHTPQKWKDAHPEWEYKFWGDESMRAFILEHYPWFIPTYDSYPKSIQRADAIRYFALYHFGGFYADMDLQPKQQIESILEGADAVLFETPNIGLTNMLMGIKKGSKFMKCIIDNLVNLQTSWTHSAGPASWKIITSTGPTMLYGVTSSTHCGKYFASGEEHLRIIKPDVIGRCSVCKVNCNPDIGVLKHLVGSSWHTWDAVLVQQVFVCNPFLFGVILVLIIKCTLLLKRHYHLIFRFQGQKRTKLSAWAQSCDGMRTCILIFLSWALWMHRRYNGE